MAYCTVVELYQATDSCRNRELATFEELEAFLEARYRGLCHQLSNLRVKYPDEWREYDGKCRDYGCSAILQNQWGSRIHVGVCKDFWLLLELDYYRRTTGERDEEGIIPFYLPEWTEFYLSELHRAADAKKIVKRWLDTGILTESGAEEARSTEPNY